jgi:hypothetical protein
MTRLGVYMNNLSAYEQTASYPTSFVDMDRHQSIGLVSLRTVCCVKIYHSDLQCNARGDGW